MCSVDTRGSAIGRRHAARSAGAFSVGDSCCGRGSAFGTGCFLNGHATGHDSTSRCIVVSGAVRAFRSARTACNDETRGGERTLDDDLHVAQVGRERDYLVHEDCDRDVLSRIAKSTGNRRGLQRCFERKVEAISYVCGGHGRALRMHPLWGSN